MLERGVYLAPSAFEAAFLSTFLADHLDVDAVEEWLVRADERYRAEAPDESWPGAYATWFLEWDEAGVD